MIHHPVTGRPLLDPDVLPHLLRDTDRWAGWMYGPPQANGRRKKMPTDPDTGLQISIANPAHLRPLDALLGAARAGRFDGLGYALDPDGELTGVDLDDVADPDTGELSAMAVGIVDDLGGTYFERSPSRSGLHGLALGRLDPAGRCRAKVAGLGWGEVPASLEVYPRRKVQFLTVTGDVLGGRAGLLSDHGPYLRQLQATLAPPRLTIPQPVPGVEFDGDADAMLTVAFRASNGSRIRKLWDGDLSAYASPSEALMGLAGFLGYYTGPDPRRLFDLLSLSPLVATTERLRPKWWTPRPGGVWGYAFCALPAILSRTAFYNCPPTCVTKSVRLTPRERLVAHCRMLSAMKSDGVFHLGVRSAVKVTGLGRTQTARLIRQLVAERVLVDVDKAKPTPLPGPASTFILTAP